MLALLLALIPLMSTQITVEQAVSATLDDFHDAASKADGDRYFGHFAEGGVFIGTDATERWTVAEFKAYAEPHFSKGKGWTYTATERHVHVGPGGKTAWFYEKLESKSYGAARGSGALVIEAGRWRIAQYVLSFPIPNEKVRPVMEALREPAQPK